MEQRSSEWYEARCGRVTASKISDLMAKTKSGYSTSRANYVSQLIAERLTGKVENGFMNSAMQHGIDTEEEARKYYETETFNPVELTGFHNAPMGLMAGASPDGLIGTDGLIEIKCPNTSTHIDYLLGKGIDRKYILQMQWQMFCTNRKWCDFMSYDNRMPVEHRAFIKRVERDDSLIDEIVVEVVSALKEVEDTINQLKERV